MKKGKGMVANETAYKQPGARLRTIKRPNERGRGKNVATSIF